MLEKACDRGSWIRDRVCVPPCLFCFLVILISHEYWGSTMCDAAQPNVYSSRKLSSELPLTIAKLFSSCLQCTMYIIHYAFIHYALYIILVNWRECGCSLANIQKGLINSSLLVVLCGVGGNFTIPLVFQPCPPSTPQDLRREAQVVRADHRSLHPLSAILLRLVGVRQSTQATGLLFIPLHVVRQIHAITVHVFQ